MMKKTIYFGSVALMLAFALIYVSVANAQNVTTNASNAMGNASANASQAAGNASANASQAAGNATNKTAGGLLEGLKNMFGGK
jgi:ABC-type oligopeptide transport system substrate-binding subunit